MQGFFSTVDSFFFNAFFYLFFYFLFQNVILDKLKGSYIPPHPYPSGRDVQILAICKEKADIDDALEAGAITAGGLEIIQKIVVTFFTS